MTDEQTFIDSYIETAIWSSTDDTGEPLDKRFDAGDLSEDAINTINRDCKQFIKLNEPVLDNLDYAQCGHDFWLTRNGHGAGFWDGDYEEKTGEYLTQASKDAGTSDLYIADDGKLWIF